MSGGSGVNVLGCVKVLKVFSLKNSNWKLPFTRIVV